MIIIQCKVCKQKNGALIYLVNSNLENGTSYRRISELIFNKYKIYLSKSTIHIHNKHLKKQELIGKNTGQDSFYVASGRMEK